MKIAVLGANGQVGAEVCLLLNRAPGVEVVPVSRNRSGSAFLRWHGLACRHGLPANASEAAGLLGDCDVVANFALSVGRPREAREANRRLIEAAAMASMPGARQIYFSTLATYRHFLPAAQAPAHTAYGREKRRCEADAFRVGRRTGKETWALRIGHVYGELQGIRDEMRQRVLAGPVVVPRGGELAANVTHTVTIVDAILKIAAGRETPGTYDLTSFPNWSWRQVLEEEARQAGVPLAIEVPDTEPFEAAARSFLTRARGRVRQQLGGLLASPRTRELGLALIAYLPESVNVRIQSRHFKRRAAAEIGQLKHRRSSHDAFTIPPLTPVTLRSLAPTAGLLLAGAGRITPAGAASFPPDMALATGDPGSRHA